MKDLKEIMFAVNIVTLLLGLMMSVIGLFLGIVEFLQIGIPVAIYTGCNAWSLKDLPE